MRSYLTLCLILCSANAFGAPEATAPTQPLSRAEAGARSLPTAQLDGRVLSSRARWSGGQIVTDSVVRGDDGRDVTVTQMGGTVDGIGTVQIPGQPLLAPGDQASLQVLAPQKAAFQARPVPVIEVLSLTRSADLEDELQSSEDDDAPESELGDWRPEPKYVRTVNEYDAPLYWSSGCVFITYDADGTSHIDGEQEFTIMDAVFDQWRQTTQSCSYLTFELSGRESAEIGFDGHNVIKFRDQRWCKPATDEDPERCYSPDAAALTTLHFVNDPESKRNGEILDADIEMNGEYFAISADGQSNGSAACLADLANTLTHEVGHLMGLDHTCRAASEPQRLDHEGSPVPSCSLGVQLPQSIREATMYNYQECGETIKATPEADDINGVCMVYPLERAPNHCRAPKLSSSSSCAIAPPGSGGTSSGLWLLLAVGAALLYRRRGC